MTNLEVHSASVGDPAKFLSLADLEAGLGRLRPQPTDAGTVVALVRRLDAGRREFPDELELSPERGVPGDAWGRGKSPDRDAQIAVVQADVGKLIANGQTVALFGDSLFLDLDLSKENLPPLSELQIGDAIVDVSPLPHTGCLKYKSRFGQDALRFVSTPALRHRNLRGIYVRVLRAGRVQPGDRVRVLRRGAA